MKDRKEETNNLIRPVFFDRQSLTAKDMNCLLDYFRNSQRRHNRHVVGWGVNCGLPVTMVQGDTWKLQVGEGHAIAPSGAEIFVPQTSQAFDICEAARKCLDIPDPCSDPDNLEAEQPSPEPSQRIRRVDFSEMPPGETLGNPADFGWVAIGLPSTSDAPVPNTKIGQIPPITGLYLDQLATIGLRDPVDNLRLTIGHGSGSVLMRVIYQNRTAEEKEITGQTLTPLTIDLAGDQIIQIQILSKNKETFLMAIETEVQALPESQEVYLGLCFDESPACFMPEVAEHCMPPDENMHPSRIYEGYKLRVFCDLPVGHAQPDCDHLKRMMCAPTIVPCPPDDGPDCVIIATISVSAAGITEIDQFRHRHQLASQSMLGAMAECCCCAQDTPPPTQLPTATPIPTSFTTPTRFTGITRFTAATSFTRFTGFPPTDIPTAFTRFTGGVITSFVPSGFPPSMPMASTIVVSPGGLDFDPVRGGELGVRVMRNVGARRAEILDTAGVSNLTHFIEHDSVVLAGLLGVSEVRIAGMQEEARMLTRRRL